MSEKCPLCPAEFYLIGGEVEGRETEGPTFLWWHLRAQHGLSIKTAADLMANPDLNGFGIPVACSDISARPWRMLYGRSEP